MKVARLYRAHDLRVEKADPPGPPGPGEVQVRMKAVGVCGSDVHYYSQGRIGSAVVEKPLIMGHEPAGVIAAVGAGVETLQVGQRVAVEPAQSCGACEPCREGHPNLCPQVRFFGTPPVDGAYCERVNVPAPNVFLLPDTLSDAEGALLETLGIGLHAVDLSHLRAGQTVAVFGTGPVGLVTLAVARTAGATRLFAVDLLPWRLEIARQLGADQTFVAGETDPAAAIWEATRGRGVDVALEAAGAAETPQQCAEVVKIGGTVVIIGIPADDSLSFQHTTVRRKGLTIKLCRRMKHTYPRAIDLMASGRIDLKPLLTHTFPLERIGEAFDLVEGYRDGVVKAVIAI